MTPRWPDTSARRDVVTLAGCIAYTGTQEKAPLDLLPGCTNTARMFLHVAFYRLGRSREKLAQVRRGELVAFLLSLSLHPALRKPDDVTLRLFVASPVAL